MLLQGSYIGEQKISLVETYRANFREFADWGTYDHLARVARLKYQFCKKEVKTKYQIFKNDHTVFYLKKELLI